MADTATLRSINCTQCAAPLTLHGGHRVQSITCGFCGSVLDGREAYKVVDKFVNRQRPVTPFKMGMQGALNGVKFTIVGMLQYRSDDGYGWLEFCLFSPTHGYAWLEQEGGHLLFTRRVRDLPDRTLPKRHKATVRARGREFQIYDFYAAKLVYVEGELTWVAKAGDVVDIVEAIDPPYMYVRESTRDEVEYLLGEYLDPDATFAAFGIKDQPPRRGNIHGAQPYTPSPLLTGLSSAAKWFAPVALLLLLYSLILGGGNKLLQTTLGTDVFRDEVDTAEFVVDSANSLLALDLDWPINNAWGYYDITVNKDQEPVFSMAKQISYYSGYSGGESWSEGAQDARAYFKVAEPGNYTISLAGEGGTGETGRVPPNVALSVTVREGVVVSRYYFFLLIITVLAFALGPIHRLAFQSRRWKEVLEEDDDDD